MDSSNEFNHKNVIEDHLYDVNENIDERIEMNEIFKYNLITDSGDVIDNNENLQSSIKSQDINPIIEYSYENNQNPISPLFMYQLSLFNLEYSTTSTNLILPQFIQNHIKSSNSFQQLWSPRVYSPKLIDSNKSKSTLSILWSLIILFVKLIITGLYFCTKILRYDAILFSLCYLLGALFGMNAYYFIDFLLILTCIISIFVATYEKWLFHYVSFIEYDNVWSNTNNENRYWKKIKLAAYGLAIGTILTFIT